MRTAGEMLVQLDISAELRQGLEDRWRHGGDPATNRVVAQLMDQLDTFEADNVESDSDSEVGDGLQADLDEQHTPLGGEIQAWMRVPSASMHAFDAEPNAMMFARMLARLREGRDEGSSSAAAQLADQVSTVIKAIALDENLREEVFLIAATALGSCSDNLAEGFSKVRLAVDNWEVVNDVKSDKMDEAGLRRWAGERFRLSLLETAVSGFIAEQLERTDLPASQRKALTEEPLETMVHAKVALRERLGLPDSTVSKMRFRGFSALGKKDLDQLEATVKAQAADTAAFAEFMLGNPSWRAAISELHVLAFAVLEQKMNRDPFHDRPLPPRDDVAAQADYAEKANQVEADWHRSEEELFRELANADI